MNINAVNFPISSSLSLIYNGSGEIRKTEITCLGYPEVYRNGVKIQLPRKKSLALLIYLAETRKKADREELRELFWPGSDRARGLGALRTSLAEISSLVDPALLGKENDAVFLTPLLFLCDSHEFLENEEKEQTLETLLDRERLWRGGFLKGFPLPEAPRFEDWVFRQEQYYDRLYRDLVKTLYYRFGKTGRFT